MSELLNILEGHTTQEKNVRMDNDFILITRMRHGDEDAFDQFVRKYYEDMLRYCIYHSYNLEDAKDLTQEIFLRFFTGFSDYKHKGKAKNYLYTIARNLCINHCKKSRSLLEQYEISGDAEDSTDFTIDAELRICLNQLSEELREVIILHYYQDIKQSEIADILGIGTPLVKYRLKKAKEQMRLMLESEE